MLSIRIVSVFTFGLYISGVCFASKSASIDYQWVSNSVFQEQNKEIKALMYRTSEVAYQESTPQGLGVSQQTINDFVHDYYGWDLNKTLYSDNGSEVYRCYAKLGDKIIGYASFRQGEGKNEIVLRSVEVDPAYMRQGLGRKLVFMIGEKFPETQRIMTVVFKLNKTVHAFFKSIKCGFKQSSFLYPGQSAANWLGYEWHGNIQDYLK